MSDWDFDSNMGPKNAFLPAAALLARKQIGEPYKLTKLTFEQCDFQGDFDHKPTMQFNECRFSKCDFAYSNWHYTSFRNCEFKDCSFSLTSFQECEFRDCNWAKIGFAGHKTVMNRTFITNPKEFIEAGFSGSDPARQNDKQHAAFQKYRLENTKAHLARGLLYSHEVVGDDETYYWTAQLHDLQQAKARIFTKWFMLRFGPKVRNYLGSIDIQGFRRGMGL